MVNSKQELNHQIENALHEKQVASPFLEIPSELRIQIYKYFLPDMEVPASLGGPIIFRHDNQPCDISIMCTSRRIHQEVLDTLYGAISYVMVMRHASITFLGRSVSPTVHQLPRTIQLINTLRLCIRIERHNRYVNSASCTKMLVDSLLLGPYKLRDLRIELEASPLDITRIFGRLGCKLDILRLDLAWNLDPLRALRGVTMTFQDSLITEGTASLCSSIWGVNPGEACPQFAQQSVAIKGKTRAFLESLAREIAQPRDD
jgi:hypothetical protein